MNDWQSQLFMNTCSINEYIYFMPDMILMPNFIHLPQEQQTILKELLRNINPGNSFIIC